MQVKLVVLKGGTKVRDIKLRLPTIVGRGRNCSLQLPHPLVSRQHCELFESDGKLIVRDLGSLNGTFLNDQKITECEAPTGSKLTIGVVSFRVEYAESSASLGASAPVAASDRVAASAPVGVSMPVSPPTPSAPAAAMSAVTAPAAAVAAANPAIGAQAAPLAAPMAVPLAGPLAMQGAAPMALLSGTGGPAPLARPVTAAPVAQFSPAMAPFQPSVAPPAAIGTPRRNDVVDPSEPTQSADENRAAMEAARGPSIEFTPTEEFAADEPGEDHVEVVEDAASLLPPVAVPPTPTLPATPSPILPAAMSPTPTNAVAASSAATTSAERPATADSEQDLLVFLKSLGK